MKQVPMPAEEQVCVIYAGVRGFLDKMVTSEIPKFEQKFLEYIKANHSKVLDDIRKYPRFSWTHWHCLIVAC